MTKPMAMRTHITRLIIPAIMPPLIRPEAIATWPREKSVIKTNFSGSRAVFQCIPDLLLFGNIPYFLAFGDVPD